MSMPLWLLHALRPGYADLLLGAFLCAACVYLLDWLEGGAFVIMRTEIDEPGIPSGISVFGSDDGTGEHFMLYFDERGVSRKYDVEPTPDGWSWSRNAPDFAQRFTLTLSPDGESMVGKGRMSRDGKPWEDDLALTYSRISPAVSS